MILIYAESYVITDRNILQVTRFISYIAFPYCTTLGKFLHKKVTEYPWHCAVINLHWLWVYHLYEDNSTNQACLTLLTVSWALSIGFCCCCTLSLAWPSCTVQHLLAACDGWVRLLDKAGYPCWPCNSTTKQHGSTVSRHQTHQRKLSEVNLHFYFSYLKISWEQVDVLQLKWIPGFKMVIPVPINHGDQDQQRYFYSWTY